jgi:hypothetical protein
MKRARESPDGTLFSLDQFDKVRIPGEGEKDSGVNAKTIPG